VSRDPYFGVQRDARICFANGAACEALGYTREELLALSVPDLDPNYPMEKWDSHWEELRTCGSLVTETLHRRKDGSLFPVEITITWVSVDAKECLFTQARDISARVAAEEARQLSEAKFQQAFQQSPDAININRLEDGVYLDVNEGFLRTTGWSREEIIGRRSTEVGIWAYPEERRRLVHQLAERGEATDFEFSFQRKDGSLGTALMSARILNTGPNRWILSVSRDITERKQVERALRDSETSYRGLFDAVGDSIFILDRTGRFIDVNQGATGMYGFTREELIGLNPSRVSAPNLNDLPHVMGCVERAFEGEPKTFEFWGERKNGEMFPKEVHLYPGTYFGQDVVIAMSTDITERKRSEAAQVAAQKLESLGVLAGGLAHDFNNLLTAIMGNLNLAQGQLGEYSNARPYLEKVEKTVLKAADLSRQMLAYSGKGHFVIKSRDLNAIVQEMTGLLNASLPKKTRLDLQLAPKLSLFKADGAQVQQVVMNLITNAADAIGGGAGCITVTTYQADLDREVLIAGFPGQALEAGSYLVLSVSDTGCGIAPDVLSRIFDPFFTTKATGRGLGLSAMLGILKGHKAGIRIQTEVGRGTTFEIFFPTADAGETQEELHGTRRGQRMAGTVLLVDDEEGILESTGPALESFGFRVVRAADGVQAMDRFLELGPELALVFMDLSMPRMDGISAFQAMRQARPQVPVVLTSGYDQKEITEDLFAQGLAGFVQKPYRIQDLARELDRVLDGRSRL
jgi:PAS domain S-box-containing protein